MPEAGVGVGELVGGLPVAAVHLKDVKGFCAIFWHIRNCWVYILTDGAARWVEDRLYDVVCVPNNSW